MIKFSKNNYCISCNKKMYMLINLPKFPVTEFFINKKEKPNKNFLVDQKLLYCEKCNHLSIEKFLDKKFIYSNQKTESGQSQGALNCLKKFYLFFRKDRCMEKDLNIIDIGGNDSSFLGHFKSKNRINIDPNGFSFDKKIKILKLFFEKIDFSKFRSKKRNIFFLSHTIEHLENPDNLIKNISANMKMEDSLFLQFPCLEELYYHQRYDQLCHQHLNIFSLRSISKLLKKYNLNIQNFEYDSEHFGTLRLKATLKNKKVKIPYLFIKKKQIVESYEKFQNYYLRFNDIYLKILKNGQGYGAGILVPVLNYYLPIINDLKNIFDDNKKKFNKKYIDMNPIIKNSSFLDRSKPVLITSISSRLAIRNIFNKLNSMKVEKIIIPSISL